MPKLCLTHLLAAAALVFAAPAPAATLVCEGILGNSGEQGDSLVRFGATGVGPKGARGIGVAFDRQGSLWDRGGEGVLNRYALDGRLLAQYRIPEGSDQNDQVALVGDLVVLRVRGALYTLSVDAPAGSEAKPLGKEAACISFNSFRGKIAVATREAIAMVDPATGESAPVAAMKGVQYLDVGPDGAVCAVIDWRMRKFVGGKEVLDGWPKGAPGERPQLVDGAWFGHTWHGTIKRFTESMEPAPGVVLGGASGSFIGHLDQNSELVNGRGMAKIRDTLYAVSGMGGVLHLLEWDASKRQMRIVRRIGPVSVCKGLGLDRVGNVWFHAGSWKWADRPDAPLEFGVNDPEYPGIGQAVMLDSDCMTAPGWLWGKPTFYFGRVSGLVGTNRVESCSLKRGFTGSAAFRRDGKLLLLVVDAAGKGQTFAIASDGNYQSDAGPATLKVATEAKEWTSLAMKDANTLLGAADGAVVEMAPDAGLDWKETRRWSSWPGGGQEDDKFGPRIWICSDSGRLWVADRERHRVLVFDLKSGAAIAAFGAADARAPHETPGADLRSLNQPETIAARGARAVVFDAGNQRLVKLSLR